MASHQQDHALLEQLLAVMKSLEEQLKSSKAAIKSLEDKIEEQKAQFHNMEYSIINKVELLLQENVNQLLLSPTSALPSNSLPHQPESSTSESFQLCFKFEGNFPDFYTKTNIEDVIASLTVELCDHTEKRVEVGPEFRSKDLKVKFLVLDGDLRDDYTEEDFKNKVAIPRNDKPPLLKGNCEVTLRNGSARVCGFSFTDNSSKSAKNGKFRLGAQLINSDRFGCSIRPAVSPPFQVKESRLKSDEKHPTPLPEDELYHLKHISKTGEIYRRAKKGGVYTVMDFLQLYHTNPSELQSILKVNGTRWKEIVAIAKECDLTEERYKYVYQDDESGDVLHLKCDFKFESVTFKGQTSQPYESLNNSEKEMVGKLRKAAYNKRKVLTKVCDSTNQTPTVQAEFGYPFSVEQEETNKQDQQHAAPSNMDPSVPYGVNLSDQISNNPSTNTYSGTTAADHDSCQQDFMNASGSLITGNFGGDTASVTYEYQTEQVADNGLDSDFTAASPARMDMQQTFIDPSANLIPSQPNTPSRDIDGGEITDLLNLLDKIERSCRRWRKFRLVPSLICHWKRRGLIHCRPHKKQKT